MTFRHKLLLLAATLGCYGTPQTTHVPDDASAGHGGGVGAAGSGGTAGMGGTAGIGGSAGSAGGAGASGGSGAGVGPAGTGGSGAGGSNPVFVGGPCIATPDREALEVFERSTNGQIYRRAFAGSTWSDWTSVPALDGNLIDARSDLDCSATLTSVHIVATGLSPLGALLHAFGFGTTYNGFVRKLPNVTFGPGPSIAAVNDDHFFVGGAPASLFEIEGASNPKELTPITGQTDLFRSGPDIAVQQTPSSGFHYFVALDAAGALAIYYYVMSSAPAYWASPVKLTSPTGSFSFSPTICTEDGTFGVRSVSVVAAAGGRLWYARTPSILSSFSDWTMISADVASSPDCAVVGADSIVHVVTLSSAGTVLDINGKDATWATTDLGSPR